MNGKALRHDAAHGMGVRPESSTIDLGPGQTWAYVPDGNDLILVPVEGAVWVTQTAGAEDLIVRRGECFRSKGVGRVVIEPVTERASVAIRRATREPRATRGESPARKLRLMLRVFFAGAGRAGRNARGEDRRGGQPAGC